MRSTEPLSGDRVARRLVASQSVPGTRENDGFRAAAWVTDCLGEALRVRSPTSPRRSLAHRFQAPRAQSDALEPDAQFRFVAPHEPQLVLGEQRDRFAVARQPPS